MVDIDPLEPGFEPNNRTVTLADRWIAPTATSTTGMGGWLSPDDCQLGDADGSETASATDVDRPPSHGRGITPQVGAGTCWMMSRPPNRPRWPARPAWPIWRDARPVRSHRLQNRPPPGSVHSLPCVRAHRADSPCRSFSECVLFWLSG